MKTQILLFTPEVNGRNPMQDTRSARVMGLTYIKPNRRRSKVFARNTHSRKVETKIFVIKATT